MLDVYWGEFMVSPAPLELSLSYCSHACAYCFANLNQPDRRANSKRILSLLQHYPERKSVAAMLLQHGYPVVVSNRVDPFAASNYKLALPLMEAMTRQEIPIVLQTKGGRGVDDALTFLNPSVWYVSIAFEDDARRAAVEPGAPSLSERYALIERLRALGHEVVVGLNPLVPEWLPDPLPTLERLKALGVHGVWIERLHFTRRQSRQFAAKYVEAMGRDAVERAHKRIAPPDWAHFLRTREMAVGVGLDVFSANQGTASGFFDPWRRLYGRTFPVLQDFVNWCHAEMPDGGLVTFDDFLAFFGPHFPAGEYGIDSYLGAVAHNLWHTHTVPTNLTYSQLLALIWAEGRIKLNPVRSPAFAMARVGESALVDERDMPVMAFFPDGTHEWWVDLDVEEAAQMAASGGHWKSGGFVAAGRRKPRTPERAKKLALLKKIETRMMRASYRGNDARALRYSDLYTRTSGIETRD